jgi:hypothetical protein
LESSSIQAAIKAEQASKIQDQHHTDSSTQALNLKGYDQVESMAWLQTTEAAINSSLTKLEAAQEKLDQGQKPVQELEELTTLITQASFQGQPLLAQDSPALDDITRLSENPPYFMTSAREAVDLFRQIVAEKLKTESAGSPSGIPLGDALAEELKSEVTQQLEQPDLKAGQQLETEFSAQGLTFKLEGNLSVSEAGELFLDEESQITTVVNGNELLLQGPFVRLLGPVSDDELQLPHDSDNRPLVGIDLQEKFQSLTEPGKLLQLEPEDLAERLNEALTLFEEVRTKLQESLQNLQNEGSGSVIESLAQAEEKVSLSIHTLSEEPWAAARTHTNATPDLVLNTMAG